MSDPNHNFIPQAIPAAQIPVRRVQGPPRERSIQRQISQMVQNGYRPDHILVGADGSVMLDLDKVEADSFDEAIRASGSNLGRP